MILNYFKKLFYCIYVLLYMIVCGKLNNIPIKGLDIDYSQEIFSIWANVYQNAFNSKIKSRGKLIVSKKVDIVIANHVSYLDNLYILPIIKSKTPKNIYIVGKKELSKVPVLSPLVNKKNHILLSRNFEDDKENIINSLKKIDDGIIFIFPEGTRQNKKKLINSLEYSKSNNLTQYNNLLYPRMKGLHLIITELANTNKLGNIISITSCIENLKNKDAGLKNMFLKKIGDTFCDIQSYKYNYNINDYDTFKTWFLMIWDNMETCLDTLKSDNEDVFKDFHKIENRLKTSSYILHLACGLIIFFYFKTIINFNFKKKVTV